MLKNLVTKISSSFKSNTSSFQNSWKLFTPYVDSMNQVMDKGVTSLSSTTQRTYSSYTFIGSFLFITILSLIFYVSCCPDMWVYNVANHSVNLVETVSHGLDVSKLFLFWGCTITLVLTRIKTDNVLRNFVTMFTAIVYIAAIVLNIDTMLSFGLYFKSVDSITMALQTLVLIAMFTIFFVSVFRSFFFNSSEKLLSHIFLVYFLLVLIKADTWPLVFAAGLGTTLCSALLMVARQATANEAAYKYTIQSAVVGTFFMYGMATILWSSNGASNILETTILADSKSFELGYTFILLFILFKLSQFPNHQWAPEVYAGIESPVLMTFLVPMKLAFVGLLYKLIILSTWTIEFQFVLLISSLVSIVLGAWGALRQATFARFFGWTSISNLGLILLPISVSSWFPTYAFTLSFFYLSLYSMILLALLVVLTFTTNSNGDSLERISDLRKVDMQDVSRIVISGLFIVLGGVPPFFGFLAKIGVLYAFLNFTESSLLTEFGYSQVLFDLSPSSVATLMSVIVFILVVFGVSITLLNYLGVIGVMFRQSSDTQVSEAEVFKCELPASSLWVLFIIVALMAIWTPDIVVTISGMFENSIYFHSIMGN